MRPHVDFHEHAQWCANTGPSQVPCLTHRGTSDAALPKIFAQDHEFESEVSLGWTTEGGHDQHKLNIRNYLTKKATVSATATSSKAQLRLLCGSQRQLGPNLHKIGFIPHTTVLTCSLASISRAAFASPTRGGVFPTLKTSSRGQGRTGWQSVMEYWHPSGERKWLTLDQFVEMCATYTGQTSCRSCQ